MSPQPQFQPAPSPAYGYLPKSAYFDIGKGGACNAIRKDLETIGFKTVKGPTDDRQATEFWIAPPGRPPVKISPPGTAPAEPYDLTSQIELIGSY